MELTPAEQLVAFIDALKSKGVRTYKGEVPIVFYDRDGKCIETGDMPIDITFERQGPRTAGDTE